MKKLGFYLLSFILLLTSARGIASPDSDSVNRQAILEQLTQIMDQGGLDNSALGNPGLEPREFNLPRPFIIGGSPVGRNDFPEYTLVILTDGARRITGLCGGTVIASNKVLTAAHCAQNRASTYFLIPGFYSFNDQLSNSDLIELSSVVDHPNYRSQGFDFDIAVMTLRRSVSIEPAKVISGNNQLVGKDGFVIGTGLTATTPRPQAPDLLLGVSTPIISNQLCAQRYLQLAGENPITTNMLCAGFSNSGAGSCSGDSGGPLFVGNGNRKAIAGVVSFGFQTCEAQRATSVYSRTSEFTDFIRQQSSMTRFVPGDPIVAPIIMLLADDTGASTSPSSAP